ncbi:hypothetical protein Taro_026665 [Colocasia esculenta]|uniref:Uncharacterized protein n=1 Tax=Colocasia esculenta TaxID=4460 RepID=A0A843VDI5_COLES|nr:hypothetical protein [Colocasia esculenta]
MAKKSLAGGSVSTLEEVSVDLSESAAQGWSGNRIGPAVVLSELAAMGGRLLKISEMADRRDWGGGGDDLEESTQRMIERI